MTTVVPKVLSPQEVQRRIITTQANIIETLNILDRATIELGDPEVRQGLDDLREQLGVLWLLYESAMRSSDAQQH
jgi:hypothetical protein